MVRFTSVKNRVTQRVRAMKFVGLLASIVVIGFVAIASGAALHLTGPARAWAPLVAFMSTDQPLQAATELRRSFNDFEAMTQKFVVEPYIGEWAEVVNESLYAFNLDEFYHTLPESETQGNDQWRYLSMVGQPDTSAKTYTLAKARSGGARGQNLDIDSTQLGELATVLRAMPVTNAKYEGRTNYLLQSNIDIAVDSLRWYGLLDAIETGFAWLQPGPMQPDTFDPYLAPVFDLVATSLPNAEKVFSQAVFVRQIESRPQPNGTFLVSGTVELHPKKLKQTYKHLASYLDSLGDILVADVRLTDKHGRTIFRSQIQSEEMRVDFTFAIKGQYLVPFDGDITYPQHPLDPRTDALSSLHVHIDSRLEVLGLAIRVDDLLADVNYDSTPLRADLSASVTRPPEIVFEGAALGIVPPGMIDFFIPGNLEQLSNEFVHIATTGNQGRGVEFGMVYGPSQPSRQSLVGGYLGFEAMNSFMVKIGARIAMKRLVPGEKARDDLVAYLGQLWDGLMLDFALFERAAAASTPMSLKTTATTSGVPGSEVTDN